MNMDDFAEIITKSNIAGKNKVEIILKLFENVEDSSSPAKPTIQKWFSDSKKGKNNKPKASRYFSDSKIKNEKKAHDFFKGDVNKDQWMELRDLFAKWRNNNQNTDKDFYINTETTDFITFSTSFWRQFASFFESLKMWDAGEEKAFQISIVNKMISTFKDTFRQYEVYRFVPEDIEHIIGSLGIYRMLLDENNEQKSKEGQSEEGEDSGCSSMLTLKKMYCKHFPNYNCFTFYAFDNYESVFKLKTEGKCILLRFAEQSNFDEMPTNEWMLKRLQYASVRPSILKEPFDEKKFFWRERQGEIIIVEIALDKDDPAVKDCYMFINEMLELDSSIDKFTTVIDEKIVKKFENLNFDNNLRMLYNNIKRYIETLKIFKEYLKKFKNLKKEKSDYFDRRELMESFSNFSCFNVSDFPKPKYPFSELYLDQEEANTVISELRYYHKSLMELYAEISSYEEDYSA